MVSNQVICVMVTFNPDLESLKKSVSSVLANHVKLIIVDNGSTNQASLKTCFGEDDGVDLILLEENKGIATAQNDGIKQALKNEAAYVWLSDQDTRYESDFSQKMLSAFKFSDSSNIAAIGPSFFDTNRGAIQPIVSFKPFTTKRQPLPGLNSVSHMIASGMFIPTEKLKLIGLKQVNLFIDWVDMEWCWRATNIYHQKLYITGDVQIQHTLGDTNVSFFGKKLILRSSFRHYFMVRNAIALALYSKSTAFFIRLELLFKALIWTLLFPMLAKHKKTFHLKATLLGMFHGFINRLGPKS